LCKNGPEHAEIKKVGVKWEEFTNQFTGFEIK